MSNHNNRVLVIGVIVVIVLAVLGAGVHLVPWLRDHRTEISLMVLVVLLVGSGFTAAVAVLATAFTATGPDPGPDPDLAPDPTADPDADADVQPGDWVCRDCGQPVRVHLPPDEQPATTMFRGNRGTTLDIETTRRYRWWPSAREWRHPDGGRACPDNNANGYHRADPTNPRITTAEPLRTELSGMPHENETVENRRRHGRGVR